MQTSLQIYEAHLDRITDACADPWFSEQLALSRLPDEPAQRRICASCLRLVLDLAKNCWSPDGPLTLLEMAEEGNVVLMRSIKRFRGSSAQEFIRELTKNVEARFTLLLEHPGWAREQRE